MKASPVWKALYIALIGLIVLLPSGGSRRAVASHAAGTYAVVSPLGISATVSSPPRWHDGCIYSTSYVDTVHFDDGTCGHATNVDEQWAIDLVDPNGASGHNVYIEINPKAFEQFATGSTYRVVAGDSDNWNGGVGNDQYQYFGIQVWNSVSSTWENYAWVVLGHIDNLQYSSGTTICGSRTTSCVAYVGKIAAGGTYPAHLHMGVRNYVDGTSRMSRSYNWDGKETADDTTLTPLCIRAGGSSTGCNATVIYTDDVGYVGGTNTTWAQLNNPYYVEF